MHKVLLKGEGAAVEVSTELLRIKWWQNHLIQARSLVQRATAKIASIEDRTRLLNNIESTTPEIRHCSKHMQHLYIYLSLI